MGDWKLWDCSKWKNGDWKCLKNSFAKTHEWPKKKKKSILLESSRRKIISKILLIMISIFQPAQACTCFIQVLTLGLHGFTCLYCGFALLPRHSAKLKKREHGHGAEHGGEGSRAHSHLILGLKKKKFPAAVPAAWSESGAGMEGCSCVTAPPSGSTPVTTAWDGFDLRTHDSLLGKTSNTAPCSVPPLHANHDSSLVPTGDSTE